MWLHTHSRITDYNGQQNWMKLLVLNTRCKPVWAGPLNHLQTFWCCFRDPSLLHEHGEAWPLSWTWRCLVPFSTTKGRSCWQKLKFSYCFYIPICHIREKCICLRGTTSPIISLQEDPCCLSFMMYSEKFALLCLWETVCLLIIP